MREMLSGRRKKMNTYAKNLKFRAAAKKAGISINSMNEYSKSKLSFRAVYITDGDKCTNAYWDMDKANGFEFYGLEVMDAMRLHAAGFELHFVEVPAEHGTKRRAAIYRLAI
jgi:hypothetical protein